MSKSLLTESQKRSYANVAKYLFMISNHPAKAEGSQLGYFMTLDNIAGNNNGLDPVVWCESESTAEKPISFNELDTDDQQQVYAALNALRSSNSQNVLKNACEQCGGLSYQFSSKISIKKEPVH